MNPKRYRLQDFTELKICADAVAKKLQYCDVLLLSGPMGVGKTRFTQELVRALGGSGVVTSPTFSLHNQYVISKGHVDHLDLYRLENDADLESSGFWDLIAEDEGVIVVEWGDRLNPKRIPKPWAVWELQFEFDSQQVRWMTILSRTLSR